MQELYSGMLKVLPVCCKYIKPSVAYCVHDMQVYFILHIEGLALMVIHC